MARRTKPKSHKRLSVNHTEAHRVRSLLLSEHVHKLNKRDVQTLVQILDEVYPIQRRQSRIVWQPLLVGVGIGLIIVLSIVGIF